MSNGFVAGEDYEPDPVFVNSLREKVVIIFLFLFFMFWTVCVSFWMGHESSYLPEDAEDLSLVWGMPSWVFYGVMLPWMVVNLIGIWFCFVFMKNDDLEADDPALSVLGNHPPNVKPVDAETASSGGLDQPISIDQESQP